jgi:hypothetical protein
VEFAALVHHNPQLSRAAKTLTCEKCRVVTSRLFSNQPIDGEKIELKRRSVQSQAESALPLDEYLPL